MEIDWDTFEPEYVDLEANEQWLRDNFPGHIDNYMRSLDGPIDFEYEGKNYK